MIADRLRAAILQAAISGKLTDQRPEDGTATELLETIKTERQQLEKEGKIKKQKPLPLMSEEVDLFDVPPAWAWVRLGQLVKYSGSGSTPKGGKAVYVHEGTMFLRSQNIHNDGLRTQDVAFVSQATVETLGSNTAYPGDLLLNITGASIGRAAVVPSGFAPSKTNQHILTIRLIDPRLARYIQTVITSDFGFRQIMQRQNGGTKEGLNSTSALSLPVPVPPVDEQERIVAKLDEVLPLIGQLAELEREYLDREFAKAIERAILQAAISGKLTDHRPEDGTATELLETIKTERQQLEKEGKIKKRKPLPPVDTSELPFGIPEKWQWVRLGELFSVKSGKATSLEEQSVLHPVPVYGGNGITGFTSRAIVSNGTLVIGRVGFYCGCVHITQSDAWISDNALEVTAHSQSIPLWYWQYVLTYLNLGQTSVSTAQPVVSGKRMYPVAVPVPPVLEQVRIVGKLNKLLPLARGIGELVL